MYERILVPLDGSKTGEAAIPNVEGLVVRMAPATKIEVILLQVVSLLTYNVLTESGTAQIPYNEKDMQQIKQKAKKYLDTVAESMRAKGINARTIVTAGHAAEEIVKVAHEVDANIIAMSTHGLSGLKRWALGSIADKVLHISDIPVFIIRAK
jgi:nucleotide-binding universal stress UspA family protein